MDVIAKPAACKARNADSRPEPGPRTCTSRVRMPCSWAFFAASSAAICAANGVDLREPLKPIVPDDDQAIELPCTSVIVIIVLLIEALTCSTPEVMFFRSRRQIRVVAVQGLSVFALYYFVPFFLPETGRALPLAFSSMVGCRFL